MRRGLVLLALLATACGQAVPSARDGWISEAPPGASALAGYVTLVNPTTAPLHCDAVSGPDFGAAELHRTLVEDGVSHMLRDQVVEVPAGGEARLAPGGLHVMLYRPQRELKAGNQATLTFACGATKISATFTLRRNE